MTGRSCFASLLLVPLIAACTAAYAPAGAPPGPAESAGSGAVAKTGGVVATRAAPGDSWAAVDARALSAPAALKEDPAALAAWLMRGARDDTEKARAIFRWLAENVAYDVGGMAAPQAVRAEDVLVRGRSICDGYASAFELLGRLAGLRVVTIRGWAKGYEYTPGRSFDRPNHAWNAVRIDGRWRPLDATWGAGYVVAGRYVKQLDDFFFLPDPEALAFTHLPEDVRWALVAQPLSLEEFQAQAVVRPPFFRAGFTAADAIAALRADGSGELVEVFLPPNEPLRVHAAPAQRVLTAGRSYHFELSAPAGQAVLLINGGTWHALAAVGGDFRGTIRPRRGDLFVAVGPRPARTYQTILRYRVE